MAGLGVGFGILFFATVLNALSLHCLFACSRADPSCSSYQALARKHLSREVSAVIELATGLLLLGAIGTTFLLSSHVLSSVQLAMGTGSTHLSEDVLSMFLFFLILPICLGRNFAALQWTNTVNFACTLGVVVVICRASLHVLSNRLDYRPPATFTNLLAPGMANTTSVGGALAVLPIILYIFFNQIIAPQLFFELKKEARPFASVAGGFATVACSLLYVAVGLLGYACFGAATTSDILVQLAANDSGDVLIFVGQALFAIVLLLSMPLVMTPLRAMVVTSCFNQARVEDVPFGMHFAITALILATSAAIARTVPWVGLLMGILGSTSVSFLALTIPGALAIRCLQGKFEKLAGYVLFGAGIVCTPLTLAALIAQHT
jgi:amino acid permease